MPKLTPKKIAKTICNILDEISDGPTADMTPSFYDLGNICWYTVDKKNPNTFILSDYDENPKFRVIVEEI